MKIKSTDTHTLLEILKISVFSFICGVLLYKVNLIENNLKTSYKKVNATKQHLFYFDNKNRLDKCETLYWILEEK